MEKQEQREADIDAIAEVLYTAIHGNYEWHEIVRQAKRGLRVSTRIVADYRLQAEHVLASSWLEEKLEDARQDGFDNGYESAAYYYDEA